MNPRPLGPEPSALPAALHPESHIIIFCLRCSVKSKYFFCAYALLFSDILMATTAERMLHTMIEQDTVKLLRECDAGVKMGVDSIEEVLPYVRADALKRRLDTCRDEHEKLNKEIQSQLDRYKDEGKDPNPMVKTMSWVKTSVKLAVNESDHTIADLMTDGCNMGVKSLNRYLNQYRAADEVSKDIAKRLIHLEEQLTTDMRSYL